jgi:hypothetical protein
MTSAIDVERLYTLGETEGYTVESADGSIGWVEEVWLGERRTPQALAMRTVDGTRALLLAEQVAAVDHEHSCVVVDADLRLRELDPRPTRRRQAAETEWPLWEAVAVLYGTIALLLAFMMTLAFTIAWAVAGTAY